MSPMDDSGRVDILFSGCRFHSTGFDECYYKREDEVEEMFLLVSMPLLSPNGQYEDLLLHGDLCQPDNRSSCQ